MVWPVLILAQGSNGPCAASDHACYTSASGDLGRNFLRLEGSRPQRDFAHRTGKVICCR